MGVIENIKKEIMTQIERKANRIINHNIRSVVTEIKNEAENMYVSFINEFYSQYTPRVYERLNGLPSAGVFGVGGGRGAPTLSISIDGNLISHNMHQNKDYVMGLIMDGFRGDPNGNWYTTWTPKYNGLFYSYEGRSIEEAFDSFAEESINHLLLRFETIFKNEF